MIFELFKIYLLIGDDTSKGVVPPVATVTKTPVPKSQDLVDIQAKLKASNDEDAGDGETLTSLQQEEEVSISGSNARMMIMQKLSRKAEVREREEGWREGG